MTGRSIFELGRPFRRGFERGQELRAGIRPPSPGRGELRWLLADAGGRGFVRSRREHAVCMSRCPRCKLRVTRAVLIW